MARAGHGFKRAHIDLRHTQAENLTGVQSLPDLIHFNAQNNPGHSFCLQAEPNRASETDDDSASSKRPRYNIRNISMRDLDQALRSCISSLNQLLSLPEYGADNEVAPVALYMESNVGLFIHLAALLEMRIPVLLLSARLSPSSVRHLLLETGSQTVLVSPRSRDSLAQELDAVVEVRTVDAYETFFDGSPNMDAQDVTRERRDQHALILHSSGTTGLPKSIPVSGRYPLVYATCHEFPEDMHIDWANMSTLPLYHGFGLLAPCLSLSVGLTCCFPPPSIIPSAQSTLDLLAAFSASSLMTVPSIVDDILAMETTPEREGSDSLSTLADLRFVAIGGGAMSPSTAACLSDHDVKLLVHYGVTELGALAPIFCPGPDYDWHFLRLRSDFGLRLDPIETEHNLTASGNRNGNIEDPRFKLVGVPVGSDQPFEIQDEMVKNQTSAGHFEVRILGRRDDLIVLKTGEKVTPRLIEEAIMSDANIQSAICVGSGYFELVVIVEPSPTTVLPPDEIPDRVWNIIERINPLLDQHARISSKSAVILKPSSKRIPRSDKGSIMRREVHEIFRDEIETAYIRMNHESPTTFSLQVSNIEHGTRQMVRAVSGGNLKLNDGGFGEDDDFFENGMDSLQSVRLARLINAAVVRSVTPETDFAGSGWETPEANATTVKADFIYRHPTIRVLSDAIRHLISDASDETRGAEERDRAAEIRSLLEEFVDKTACPSLKPSTLPTKGDKSIILTGSTGNLGAHVLRCLCRDSSVRLIFCLLRPHAPADSDDTCTNSKARARQEQALDLAGIQLNEADWSKIRLMESTYGLAAEHMGLEPQQISEVTNSVTHIIHMAWPMDFNRQLQSFRPHLEVVKNLLQLVRTVHRTRPSQSKPVRLLFTSSIAVARNHENGSVLESQTVPESELDNPLFTAEMGYAEAKWICEQLLVKAGRDDAAAMEVVTVRVGQLSGPETGEGVWKTAEHIPALLKASQMISAFPRLEGTMSWLPVDRAAKSLIEILFQPGALPVQQGCFFHLENPVRQLSRDFAEIAMLELGLRQSSMIDFDDWVVRVVKAGSVPSLERFFRGHFRVLAGGSVVLTTDRARSVSRTLRGTSAISKDLLIKYIDRWKNDGFLEFPGSIPVPHCEEPGESGTPFI